MKANVLVVAHRTAASDDLLAALRGRAETTPARFELLVPPTHPGAAGREAARTQLERALARMQEFGLEASGAVGWTTTRSSRLSRPTTRAATTRS